MSRHRKPAVRSSRRPVWRIVGSLVGVVSMVAAMAVVGSSAQAATPPYQVTAGVALTPDDGLPSGGVTAALALPALASNAEVDPGTDLTYVLQVTNTSSDTTPDAVTVVDDVSGLLDHATITTSAEDLAQADLALDREHGILTWTPANPPAAGQVASTLFEVTVDDDVRGTVTVATAAAPEDSECTTDSCVTSLSITGAPAPAADADTELATEDVSATDTAAPTTPAGANDAATDEGDAADDGGSTEADKVAKTSSPGASSTTSTETTTSAASSAETTSGTAPTTATTTTTTTTTASSTTTGETASKTVGSTSTKVSKTSKDTTSTSPTGETSLQTQTADGTESATSKETDSPSSDLTAKSTNSDSTGATPSTMRTQSLGAGSVTPMTVSDPSIDCPEHGGSGSPTVGDFEIDGDCEVDDWGNLDWDSRSVDASTTTDSGTFGSNNKDNSDPNGWDVSGSTPDKGAITAAGYWSQIRRVDGDPHSYLYGFWTRPDAGGTAGYILEIDYASNTDAVGGDGGARPDRSNGGQMFVIGQSGNGSLTVDRACHWDAGESYPGDCDNDPRGDDYEIAVGNNDRFVETGLDATALTGVAPGCPPPSAELTLNLRSYTGKYSEAANLKAFVDGVTLQAPEYCASLTVHAGGVRTGESTVAPLPDGAVFAAYGVNRNGDRGNEVDTCTISNGTCTLTVLAGEKYYVAEKTLPTTSPNGEGWYLNQRLGTDSGAHPYQWETDRLEPDETYDVPGDTDGNGSHHDDDTYHDNSYNQFTGLLSTSLGNPPALKQCGLNMALILDQSGSMDGTKQDNLIKATEDVIEALSGTPSTLSMYTFSAGNHGKGPGIGGVGSLLDSDLSIQSGVDAATNWISDTDRFNTNTPDGGTNWDQGIFQAVSSSNDYDLALIITDGDPTTDHNGTGQGESTRFANVDNGIFSANALKALGTRVVALGVGLGTSPDSGSAKNLRAISGPTLGSDYYLGSTDDFGAIFKQIASGNCQGKVTVQKQIEDPNGNLISPNPTDANGWQFDASISSGSTIGSFGATSDVSTTPGETKNGFTSTDVGINVGATPTITITEQLKGGYAFVDASCIVNGHAAPNSMIVGESTDNPGISFTAEANAAINCKFINKQPKPTLTLVKKVDNGSTGATAQPSDWTLHAKSDSETYDFVGSDTGTTHEVLPGTYTLSETGSPTGYDASDWTCVNHADERTTQPGDSVTVNVGDSWVCTITNSAEQPTLRLIKNVHPNGTDGKAEAADWTLSATGDQNPPQSMSGKGDTGVHTVPAGKYTLVERPTDAADDVTNGYRPGDWQCSNNGDDPESGDTVTVAPGDNWVCTITNTAVQASVTVTKVWIIDGETYTVPQGDGPALPDGFSADLTLTGTGHTDQAWGQKYTGYKQGDTVTIGEKSIATPNDSACAVAKSGDLGDKTLKKGDNTYTVTNTVTCQVSVELTKVWKHGIDGDAVDLAISGDHVADATDGSSTVPGDNTKDAKATAQRGSTITLAESFNTGSPSQYNSSLVCTVPNADGSTTDTVDLQDGLSGELSIPADTPPGATITCQFTNSAYPSTVTLGKKWTNAIDGNAVTLTVKDKTTGDSGDPATSTAPDAADPGNTTSVAVYPGDTFKISEAAATTEPVTHLANYAAKWYCSIGGELIAGGSGNGGTVDLSTSLDAHSTIDCTIENTRKSATVTLTKKWLDPIKGDGVDLAIGGDVSGAIDGSSTVNSDGTATTEKATATALVGDTVTIGETAKNGTDLDNYGVSYACKVGSTAIDVDATAHMFTVPASAATSGVDCTITNKRGSVTVTLQKKWVNGADGDKTDLSINGKSATDDHGFAVATVNSAGSAGISTEHATLTVDAGSKVNLKETLDAGNIGGYTVSDFTCAGADSGWTSGTSASFTAPGSGSVTCTVTNTRTKAHLILQKAWVNGAKDDSTTIHATGNDETTRHATSTVGDTPSFTDTDNTVKVPVYSGEEVSVFETVGSNHGTYDAVLSCPTDSGATVGNPNGKSGTVTLPKTLDGNITCTYTNTRTSATLHLAKTWANGAEGDTAELNADGDGQSGHDTLTSTVPEDAYDGHGTYDPAGGVYIPIYSGDSVDLTETLGSDDNPNTGAYDTTLQCGKDGAVQQGVVGTYEVPAQPKDITCTFTNTRKTVDVQFKKDWENAASGDATDLVINDAVEGDEGFATSQADGTNGVDSNNVATATVFSGATVDLAENLAVDNNAGTYTSSLQCTGTGTGTGASAMWDVDKNTGSLTAPASGSVSCTVTNTRKSVKVHLQKTWVNGFATDTTKLTVSGSGTSDDATSTADGTPGTQIDTAAADTATITALSGDTVTLSEVVGGGNHGYYTATDLACTVGTSDLAVEGWQSGETSGTITAPASGEVTCVFTNTRSSTTLSLKKHWDGAFADDVADLYIDTTDRQLSGDGTATATVPDGGSGDATQSIDNVTVYSGDTLTLGETLPDDNTGSYTSSISCSPGHGFASDQGSEGRTGTLTVSKAALDKKIDCTVYNSRKSVAVTLQKDWIDSVQGDTAGLSINSGDAVAAIAPGGSGPSPEAATATVPSGSSVTLGEVMPADGHANTGSYNVTGLECVNKSGDTVTVAQDDDDPASGSFHAPSGGDVTCTFTNKRTQANLTLVKKWINGAEGDTATLTAGQASMASTVRDKASFTDDDHAVVTTVLSGQEIELSETFGDTEHSNTGTYTPTLTCDVDGLGTTTVTDAGISGTFTMPSTAENVTCTVTNTRTSAHITLQKKWDHGAKGDTAHLSLTSDGLSGPGSVDSTVATDLFTGVQDGDSDTVTVYSGDRLKLSETLGTEDRANTGTYSTSLVCGTETIDLTDLSATFEAPTSDETCTFTNKRTSATLTLNKVWDHGADGDTATLTAVNGSTTKSGSSIATGAETQRDEDVTTIGIYSGDTVHFSEILGTKDQPNTGAYTTGWLCTDDDANTGDTGIAHSQSGIYTVPADPTDTSCTFTNTRTSTTLTLVKDWVGGMSANKAVLAIDGNGQTGSGTATATVPSDDYTDASSEIVHVTAYSGDTADLTETLAGPNAHYTSRLDCTDGGTLSDNTGTSGTVTIDGTPKDGITCTLTNTAVAAEWKVEKTADPATGSVVEPGQTITYTLTATHESGVSPTNVTVADDLSDVVNHASDPDNITVSVDDGSATYDSDAKTLTWHIARLDDTATVKYTVTVDEDASNVVLRNHATGGTDGPCVEDCSTEHIVPKVTKTYGSAQQHMDGATWDGTWDVTYTLSVTNPSTDLAVTYHLSDTPAFPDDVTPNGGSVTDASNQPADSPDATEITDLTNTWNGTGLDIVTGRQIPAGSTDIYLVTINASAPLVGAAPQCGDGPGNGFDNTATATFDDATFDDSDCGDIPQVATPAVTKDVASTTQNTDGTWTIVYDITVTNPSDEWATQYDVTDELHYGAGITVADGDAAVTGPDANPNWDGASDTSVATGQYLNKGASATYQVTVTATVAPDAWTGTDGASAPVQCQPNEPGGFGNSSRVALGQPALPAELRGAGGALLEPQVDSDSQHAYACSEPVQPEVAKTFNAAAPNADGGWDVSYTVTVTNPAEKLTDGTDGPALMFTLTDTPSFPAGVEVTGAEVTDSSIAGLGSGSYDSSTGVLTIVASPGASLGAGDSQTFDVTVHTAAPEAPLPTSDLTCTTDTPNAGFDNTATVTSGGQDFSDEACGNIPAWTVSKTVDQQIAEVGDTLTYTLTATDTGPTDVSGVTATDELPDGVTLVTDGLDSGLVDNGDGTLTWAIPDMASGSDPVTVSYRVTVDESASGTTQTNLVVPNGPAGHCATYCSTDTDIPEWTVSKSAEQQVANPGDTVTYTLTAHNTGDVPVDGATATDTLPAGVTLVTDGLDSGLVDNGDGTLTWAIPDMASGSDPVTVRYSVTVDADAAGTTQTNLVVPDTPGGQCVPGQPRSETRTGIAALVAAGGTTAGTRCTTETEVPAWTLAKTSDPKSGSTVETGSTISYTLTVTNNGPGVLNGATVIDDLTEVLAGATFDAFTEGFSTRTDNTLTWEVPDGLAVGDTASLTYTVTVDSDANGMTLTNVATPGNPAGECVADGGCTTTHTVPPLDVVLGISKDASADTVSQGDEFSYSITVSNSTDGTADPVTLTDPIPAQVSVIGITTDTTGPVSWQDCAVTGADANGYGGTLTCTLSAPLTAGETAPAIVLDAVIASRVAGPTTITNTATVTWENPDQPDLGSQSARDSADVEVPIEVAPTTEKQTPTPTPTPSATPTPSSTPTPTTTTTTVTPPVTTTITPTTSTIQVLPTTDDQQIAYTGIPTWKLGWAAAALLGIGLMFLLLGATRRRRIQKH